MIFKVFFFLFSFLFLSAELFLEDRDLMSNFFFLISFLEQYQVNIFYNWLNQEAEALMESSI